ncbi:RsmB/NOP family class I SAM-dependent RNA methyltransferase [Jatrophihabitans sp. GAS493]|uniref:RsmB/NOP family class I SAM-dependent RNA methyltransferase n=1 Tax=Jatrophihabitans sp. GAS493 TaxID=1907575 RepID=UPI00352AA19D
MSDLAEQPPRRSGQRRRPQHTQQLTPQRAAPGTDHPEPDRARRVVFELLREVAELDAYANLVLPRLLSARHISGRDAAFATELGYGTLRAQGTLDAILSACVDRELSDIEPAVLDLLRLGAYQVLRTRIPPHAAVGTTVELARATRNGRASGFVNAVLRRVTRNDWDGWVDQLSAGLPALDRISLQTAHPRWIADAFADALAHPAGSAEEPAGNAAETELGETELAEALQADDARPQTHLVAWPGQISVAELVAEADGEPGPYSPYAVRMSGGDPASVAAIRARHAAVQDEGSQLCAIALTEAPLDGPDVAWLDLCSGPGGKTALLAAIGAPRGVRLTANELHPHRAELVAKATISWPVQIQVGDARQLRGAADLNGPAAGFDRVLLDAPCSGLGALRRRPEARWRREPSDILELAPLQGQLLDSALRLVRPGGVVAYVTCSPHRGETVQVIEAALQRHPGTFDVLDARPSFPGVDQLGTGPFVQLWPHRHGTDAMFCALLRRRS